MSQHLDWNIQQLPQADHQRPDPDKYLLDEGLAAALKVAVALNQPLLLTGEPGTGKTQLAHKAAAEFHRMDARFLPQPLEFHTKTTSAARDLLYHYDAVRHFHDAGLRDGRVQPDEAYIELRALGEAILRSHPDAERREFQGRLEDAAARSSVVLIDEIDKAPRDFPNDLLHEIERLQFSIPEIRGSKPFGRDGQQRIVVILTSNSEKNLPEAFLRRCVFFHIASPDAERLRAILASHLHGPGQPDYSKAEEFLTERFLALRDCMINKRPSTAELLNWVRILGLEGLLAPINQAGSLADLNAAQRATLKRSLAVLVKTTDDAAAAAQSLGL
jgi:MoxR-like ATPase